MAPAGRPLLHRCSRPLLRLLRHLAAAPPRTHTGVVVVDATGAAIRRRPTYLTTHAMYRSAGIAESERTAPPAGCSRVPRCPRRRPGHRALRPGGGLPLSATALACPAEPALRHPDRVRADEGSFSPDGLTYYATNLPPGLRSTSSTSRSRPSRSCSRSGPCPSIRDQRICRSSADGNRAYLTLFGHGQADPVSGGTSLDNGIVIADVSDVQSRSGRIRRSR